MPRQPVVIVAGGDAAPASVAEALPADAFVIAADSGLHTANDLGLRPDLVVGDLDSADPAAIAAARDAGVPVETHPADKDATDLELALEAAADRGLGPAVVIGGASLDRIDHFIANALLMAADRFATLEPTWLVKGREVHVVRSEATIRGTEGDIVTLLPVGGPARGVRTKGLRWALDDETLEAGSTRGVSNVLERPEATVSVESGVLIAIHGGTP
ncbi:MAG: thiamine diphosphokinase [Acidimicrobiia bacterium]|nr:thiamine diphosphokinase [Acidimicrobiia bacterium]